MSDPFASHEIWVADFEYSQATNHLPSPHCLVAREVRTGRLLRVWLGGNPPARPPFDVTRCIYVAYNAVAEGLCHLALGWPLPRFVIDLYAEFRNLIADRRKELEVDRLSLLDALKAFGLPHISAAEKTQWRDLAVRGGSFTAEEKAGLLDYCQEDVDGTAALLEKMRPNLDVQRALLRGRFAVDAAVVQKHGIPVDLVGIETVQSQRDPIRRNLIREIDKRYHLYVDGAFSEKRFLAWLISRGIHWPQHPSGSLKLDRDTFSDMARLYPEVSALHELRKTLAELTNQTMEVAPGGRCHVAPGVFGTLTGRNCPRSADFIFARAKWWRNLIKAPPGHALIYLDWRSQEFAIAAALSGDDAMMAAYRSGDAYLGFGKACGAIPAAATKASHPELRQRFKVATLALQFGIGAEKLGRDLGGGPIAGHRMLDRYKSAFPVFTRWSQGQADKAALGGVLLTPFGWRLKADALDVKPRTFKNFPVQATGGDMMRIAVILMVESEVKVCAMVHDGFLVECPLSECARIAAVADKCMREASRFVLYGFEVDVDTTIYEDRFRDPSGVEMWEMIRNLTGLDGGEDPSQSDLPPQSN